MKDPTLCTLKPMAITEKTKLAAAARGVLPHAAQMATGKTCIRS